MTETEKFLRECLEIAGRRTAGEWHTIGGIPTIIRTSGAKDRSDYIAHLNYGSSTAKEMFHNNATFIAHAANTYVPIVKALMRAVEGIRQLESAEAMIGYAFDSNHYPDSTRKELSLRRKAAGDLLADIEKILEGK